MSGRIYRLRSPGRQLGLLLVLLCSPAFAAEGIKLSVDQDSAYTRLKIRANILHFEASLSDFHLEYLDDERMKLVLPGSKGKAPVGEPDLPGWTALLESGPLNAKSLKFEVLDSVVFDLANLSGGRQLYAVQQRDSKGSVHGDALKNYEDRWYGGPVLEVDYEGVMRGLPISTLRFRPFRYHPGQQLLVVYSLVCCSLELTHGVQSADQAVFRSLFQKVERQESRLQTKALQAELPLGLIVLSDTIFRQSLQPLISWKRKRGFRVVEIYRQEMEDPSVSGIKKKLEGLYREPPPGSAPPSYLLIVGDVQHIPHSGTGANVTDLYYCTFDGEEDFLPELFCGRISVKDSLQLATVSHKIMEYEGHDFPDAGFLERSILIAGVDGVYAETHGNGQLDYLHDNYLKGLAPRQDHVFFYPGSDTASSAILDLLGSGVGFVNYTGHGEWDRWRNPLFSKIHIAGLENSGAYPLIIANGCETNYFTRDECLAEALLRAPGKGALAYIGCTSDSFWDEDYYWSVGVGEIVRHPEYESTSLACFDRSFHTHGEDYSQWAATLGEMIYWGNMAVLESGSSLGKLYWEIYQLAGDPTLQPWFSPPLTRHPLYPRELPPGNRSLNLRCDPYAYVALSLGDSLLFARHASGNGLVSLPVPELPPHTELDLVISGQGLQAHEGRINITNSEDVFLEILVFSFSGEEGEICLHPGAELLMDLVLVNHGGGVGTLDTLILRSGDAKMQLLDSTFLFAVPAPGDSLYLPEAFRFRVSEKTVDGESCLMLLDPGSGQSPLFLESFVKAPRLFSGGIRWEESGARDGQSSAGEWIRCSWSLYNGGRYKEDALEVDFRGLNPLLFDSLLVEEPINLSPGDSVLLHFMLRLAPDADDYAGSGQLFAGRGSAAIKDSFALWPGGYLLDCTVPPGENFPFKNDSAHPWMPVNTNYLSAPFAYRSGTVSHQEASRLEMNFHLEETAQLEFSYRVSSELDYDFLVFKADSLVLGRWSGEREWTRYALELDSGLHQLSWSYEKDKNTSVGMDAAWIDDLHFPGGTFSWKDLEAVRILNASSAPGKVGGEKLGLLIRNTSHSRVEDIVLEYSINGKAEGRDSFPMPLDPGGSAELYSSMVYNFMGEEERELSIRILSDSLSFQGNNRAGKKVFRYVYPDMAVDSMGILYDVHGGLQLIIVLENRGNVEWKAGNWECLLDGKSQVQGEAKELLQAGERQELLLSLLAPGENLDSGSFTLTFLLHGADSLEANNHLEKSFVWTTVQKAETGTAGMWFFYPNPVSGQLVISRTEDSGEELVFELRDAMGRLYEVFVLSPDQQREAYTLDAFSSGVYLLSCPKDGSSNMLIIH